MLTLLTERLCAALGEDLLAVWVHGSYTAGDFHPERSDLDLFAVLRHVPTDATLAALRPLHLRLATEQPTWRDRIEVSYLAEHTLTGLGAKSGPMVRLSPGEPLHLLTADRHRLLDVASARATGRALHGPHPSDLLPAVEQADLRAVAEEHAASWPTWVLGARDRVGAQAYAVLTICRIAHLLATDEQASKRAAATWAAADHPASADLIRWASRWWYGGGTEPEPGRFEEVQAFVDAVSVQYAAQPGAGSATRQR